MIYCLTWNGWITHFQKKNIFIVLFPNKSIAYVWLLSLAIWMIHYFSVNWQISIFFACLIFKISYNLTIFAPIPTSLWYSTLLYVYPFILSCLLECNGREALSWSPFVAAILMICGYILWCRYWQEMPERWVLFGLNG